MKLAQPLGLLILSVSIFISCSKKKPQDIAESQNSYFNDSIYEDLNSRIDNRSKFECDLLKDNPPGDTPTVFLPGKVSTGKENGAITFSPGGDEIWFARINPAQIFYMKKEGGKWKGPQPAPFSGKFKDLYPSLSPNGNKLFFASDRPLNSERKEKGKKKMKKHMNIWESKKMQSGWTEPRSLSTVINFGMFQICPTISAKGTLFYNLVINNKDSSFLDIYESKHIYNTFSKPKSVGVSINSASLDYAPFIAKDESYIIFASKRHGYGKTDLFISYKNSNGDWTEAINMGPTINTRYNEDFPSVSPDGKHLFFNSNRARSSTEETLKMLNYIYWVNADIIDRLRPNYLEKIGNEKGKRL